MFKHSFTPQFSVVLLLVVISVIAAAYLIGYWSVRIAPRRSRKTNGERPEGMPRYNRAKARGLTKSYSRITRRMQYENTAVIVLRSTSFDNIVGVIGSAIVTCMFFNEHFVGLTQWFINHLSANDDAAWGLILAYCALCALFAVVAEVVKFFCRVGQAHKARSFADAFIAEKVRPIFGERRSVAFFAKLIAFVVREDAKEKKAKAEAMIAEQKEKMANRDNVIHLLPESDHRQVCSR